MSSTNATTERADFRDAALRYGDGVLGGDSEAAAKGSARVDEVADLLRLRGRLFEVLEPLLEDDNAHVQFAAAAHLNRDGHVRAHALLKELAQGSGLASLLARMSLSRLPTDVRHSTQFRTKRIATVAAGQMRRAVPGGSAEVNQRDDRWLVTLRHPVDVDLSFDMIVDRLRRITLQHHGEYTAPRQDF